MSNEPKDFSDQNKAQDSEESGNASDVSADSGTKQNSVKSETPATYSLDEGSESDSSGETDKSDEVPASSEGGAEVAMAVPPSETAAKDAAKDDTEKPQKSGGKGLSILALLIALIALILVSGLSWLAWQEYQKQQLLLEQTD